MTLRCVLGVAILLAPSVARGAPDDARQYSGPMQVRGAPEPPAQTAPAKPGAPPSSGTSPSPPAQPVPDNARRSAKKSFNPRIPKLEAASGAVVQPWVRNTLYTEWYRENYNTEGSDDNFVSLVNRLNLGQDTRMKRATLGTQFRLDSQNIWFTEDRGCSEAMGTCVPVEGDVRLERATVRLDTKHVSAYGGDFNVNMGRGLGLSVRKIDEIGVDATIKGGRVDVRTKPIRATAIAGFANRQNSDFATRQLISDPGYPAKSYTFSQDANEAGCDVDGAIDPDTGNPLWTVCSDFLAGGRVEVPLPGRVDVGANYVYLDFGDEVTAGVIDEYLHQFGGDIGRARIGGVWDTFVGASGLMRNPNLAGTEFESQGYNGYSLYSSNTFYTGTTTILVEGKHYRDYLLAVGQNALLQYTENPTLEREDQQVPGNLNATGGRMRVDHTWRERGLTVFGNTLAYAYAQNERQDQFGLEDSEGLLATHNFGGIIFRKPKSDLVAQVSAGYRYERWLREPTPGEGALRRRFPHAEFYVTVPVARTGALVHALAFRGEGRWENLATVGQREDFFRGLFTFGYSMSPWFSVTYLQGFDTELPTPPGEPSLTDEECSGGSGSTCRPHLWPGMQAQINFWGSSFIRIFAGRQVGGRVCVNGSCRTLPDFEGVRSELVFSF
ncbi:MAG: hypothetical protein ACRBN8_05945 [Nannocystales bacterium]